MASVCERLPMLDSSQRRRLARGVPGQQAVSLAGGNGGLMEHQESLHRQFLDTMERRDEAWHRQEADKFAREAAARAQDRASAAAREAAIIAYLEKISGETITLPPPADDSSHDAAAGVGKELVVYDGGDAAPGSGDGGAVHLSTSRWPKH